MIDSYLTADEAEAFMGPLVDDPAWASVDAARREGALRLATLRVDAGWYQGERLDPDQPRQFPRRPFPGRVTIWSFDPQTEAPVVPPEVLAAVVFEALAILAGVQVTRDARHAGLASQSAGPVSESYMPAGVNGVPPLCETAELLLRRFRLSTGRLQ